MKWMTVGAAVALGTTLAIALLAASCGEFVSGSGELVGREIKAEAVTRVEVGHDFDLEVVRGDIGQAMVTIDDNLEEYLELEVDGDTLRIGLQDGNSYSDTTLIAEVTLPTLEAVSLSGAADGSLSGFSSEEALELSLSGASSLKLVNVAAGHTSFQLSGAAGLTGMIEMTDGEFSLSGASEVDLSGSGASISIDASGASDVDLAQFSADDVSVGLSGGSEAVVMVNGRLDAELSGGSDLRYLGDPQLGDLETSGGSEIKRGE